MTPKQAQERAVVRPKDCKFPKNCGYIETKGRCSNLACNRLRMDALLASFPEFWAGDNPFAASKEGK